MASTNRLRLALAGDLMLGRGIDQAFPTSCDPRIYERFVGDARDYIALAEERNGPISKPISPAHLWGDAAAARERHAPDLAFANLETAVTTYPDPWPGKAIHYRMHPDNLACLTAFGWDGVSLANNHVLDWDVAGLEETLRRLDEAGLPYVGAGRTAEGAAEPWRAELKDRSVAVLAYGSPDSGVPDDWAAGARSPGVSLLPDFAETTVDSLIDDIEERTEPDEVVTVSVHWGANWGWEVPAAHRRVAHRLIDEAGVDVVHGHSAHHPRPLELYRGKLILYGCGDFVNDYEGIGAHEAYRGDLAVLYLADLDAGEGTVDRLVMEVFQIHRFGLRAASEADAAWLAETLNGEAPVGPGEIELAGEHRLVVGPT